MRISRAIPSYSITRLPSSSRHCCAEEPRREAAEAKKPELDRAAETERMELARHLLWREQTGRLELLPENVSGVRDGADAKSNIEDTADGKPAKRSAYGNAPGGTVYLSLSLLGGLKALTREFEFAITSIAGGSHSVGSNHYRGVSVDVDTINGQRVSAAHPTYRYFMQRAEELGATERYGPGDRGHSGHIHLSW